ncbi:MAG: cell division protein FtsA [Armatimonadetes bacterium]|nr:cell division protein FtsA [Armatimonadota bacterium]MDW8153075.1 cell division protein FtsA [Armatimonadota bacterium]
MARPHPLVGLDIGTTKVCAVVAQAEAEDQLRLLGAGTAPSAGLRRGAVSDLRAATQAVERAVERAEKAAGREIRSVYVAVSGDHVTGQNTRGVVAVSSPDREISSTDVARALEAARMSAVPAADREVLHVLPRHFVVDGTDGVRNPVGMYGVRLEVEAHVVTGSSTQVANLVKCVEQAGLEVEGLVLAVLASAEAVLTVAERELGVAVCEVGGGVTSLGIFQGGALCHTAVVPVGGQHITSDLAVGLRTSLEEAERIKLRFGAATARMAEEGELLEVAEIGAQTPRIVPRRGVCEIIEARVEELLELVRAQLERWGPVAQLPAGVVLTGGSTLLSGLVELASERWGLPVRVGHPRGVVGPAAAVSGPAYATVVGLLLYAHHQAVERSRRRDGAARGILQRLRTWLVGE